MEFLDKTDVDTYSYHNIFDISQSQHRRTRVDEGSKKNSFAVKLFMTDFSVCRHSSVIPSLKKWIVPKENSVLWSTVCPICWKLLIKRANVYKFQSLTRNIEYGSVNSKDNPFAHFLKGIIEDLNRLIRFSFRFQITLLASFPSKGSKYTVISFHLQKLST